MTDNMATLGIAVDSSQVVTATQNLDKLKNAAGPASAAMNTLTNAGKSANDSFKTTAATANNTGNSIVDMAKRASEGMRDTSRYLSTTPFKTIAADLASSGKVKEALSFGIQSAMSHVSGLDPSTWKLNEDLVDHVVNHFGDIASIVKTQLTGMWQSATQPINNFVAGVNKSGAAIISLAGPIAGTTKGTKDLSGATKDAAGAHEKAEQAATHSANAHAGMSTQAMAAMHSIRSLGEAMASGMPLSTALAQQMSHLSYAASGPQGLSGAFKEAAGAFSKMLSPTTLLVGGLAAVTIGTAAMITKLGESEIKWGDLADRSGVAVQALHALESAMAMKGISNSSAFDLLQKFQELTEQAKLNTGPLASLFATNNLKTGDLQQNILSVADLMSKAKDGGYAIAQSLGMSSDQAYKFVQFMHQGPEAIKATTAAAVQLGNDLDKDLIQRARELNEKWDSAWDSWKKTAQRAILSVAETLGIIGQKSAEVTKQKILDARVTGEEEYYSPNNASHAASPTIKAQTVVVDTPNPLAGNVANGNAQGERAIASAGIDAVNRALAIGLPVVNVPLPPVRQSNNATATTNNDAPIKYLDTNIPTNSQNTLSTAIEDVFNKIRGLPGNDGTPFEKFAEPNNTPLTADELKATFEPFITKIGNLGQLASPAQIDAKTAAEQVLARSQPNGSGITAEDSKRIIQNTEENAIGKSQIDTQIDAVKRQTAAYTMGVGPAAAYEAEQSKIDEAARRGVAFSGPQLTMLHQSAQAYGTAAQQAAELKSKLDALFQTEQLGRDSIEQGIASKMKADFGPLNYVNHMNDATANLMRMNAVLGEVKNTASSALSGFLTDIRDGKTASEAFTNALNKIEDKIFQMASDKIISALFNGLLSSGSGGSFLSGLFGSTTTKHSGAGPGEPTGTSKVLSFELPRFHGGTGPLLFDTLPHFHAGTGPLVPVHETLTQSFQASPHVKEHTPSPSIMQHAPQALPHFHGGTGPLGLAPGERPAIILDSESVLTTKQMAVLGLAIGHGDRSAMSNSLTSGQMKALNLPKFHDGVGPSEMINAPAPVARVSGGMIANNNNNPTPNSTTTPPVVNIGIQNYSGQPATVQQSAGSGGALSFNVIIGKMKEAIAGDIARGGTTVNSAMEKRYGLNAALGNVR